MKLRFYPYFFGFPPARFSFSAVPSARFYTNHSSLRLFSPGSSSLFIPLFSARFFFFGNGLQCKGTALDMTMNGLKGHSSLFLWNFFQARLQSIVRQ
jgi:hypothetical protein